MPRPLRAALWLAYAVYLSWVVYLVWTPSPGLPGTTITRIVNLATRLGVTLDSSQVEFTLNIVMLVPLSLIGGLLFQRLRVTDWTALGFGASLTDRGGPTPRSSPPAPAPAATSSPTPSARSWAPPCSCSPSASSPSTDTRVAATSSPDAR